MSFFDNVLAVWNIRGLKLPEKAVLSNLARRADDEGIGAFPSELRIALETSQSTKTVERVLGRLIEYGYISRKRRSEGKSSSLFGHWEYTVNVMKILDESEEGEDAIRELLDEERENVRVRVQKFREKVRSKKPDVTDTRERVTDSEALRNILPVVTVTDPESLGNGQTVRLTSRITAPSNHPVDLPAPPQPVRRKEPIAGSRETRSPAAVRRVSATGAALPGYSETTNQVAR